MTMMDRSRPRLTAWILFGSAFLGYVVPLILPIFMRDIARDLHIDVSLPGVLAGVQGFIIGLASLVVGPLSDRYGRKAVLSYSLLLNGFSIIAFSTAWDLTSLYAFGILSAVTFSPLVFCSLAYIADYFPAERRGEIVGFVTASLYGVVIVGAPLGVVLMEMPQLGWRSVFVVIGVLSILMAAASFAGLRHIATGNEKKAITVRPVVDKYLSFAGTPRLRGFLAIFFLLRIGLGMYFVYAAAYLFISRAFPPHGLVIVYPIGGALAFGASMLAGKFTDKIGGKALIFFGSLAITLSILMIVHVPTTPQNIIFVMTLLCGLYMVSDSVRMAALQTEAVSIVPAESRGAFLGATSFLMYLGYAVGAFLGGLILQLFKNQGSAAEDLAVGFTVVVYVASFLWVVTMVLALYYTKGSVKLPARAASPS